jgi:hypothetical protein
VALRNTISLATLLARVHNGIKDLIGVPHLDLLDLLGLAIDSCGHGAIVVHVTPNGFFLKVAHVEASIASGLLLSC